MYPLGSAILILAIRLYRAINSALGFRSPCRFYPSCSAYASEAIVRHGSLRGVAMSAGRLLRCNPWNPGGIDLPYRETS